jgi:hypothetical protein
MKKVFTFVISVIQSVFLTIKKVPWLIEFYYSQIILRTK